MNLRRAFEQSSASVLCSSDGLRCVLGWSPEGGEVIGLSGLSLGGLQEVSGCFPVGLLASMEIFGQFPVWVCVYFGLSLIGLRLDPGISGGISQQELQAVFERSPEDLMAVSGGYAVSSGGSPVRFRRSIVGHRAYSEQWSPSSLRAVSGKILRPSNTVFKVLVKFFL